MLRLQESSTDKVFLNSDEVYIESKKTFFKKYSSSSSYIEINTQDQVHPDIRPYANYRGYIGQPTRYWQGAYLWNVFYHNLQYVSKSPSGKSTDIKGALQRIIQIEGKKVKSTGSDSYEFDPLNVKDVFPNLVEYYKESDNYGISISQLLPVLVEAIKEQQQAQNYTTTAKVLSSGGTTSSVGVYTNFSVVGETFVNENVVGDGFNNAEGFIHMESGACSPPVWEVGSQYYYTMVLAARVFIDGNPVGATDDVLAAFHNGECVGKSNGVLHPSGLFYYFTFNILSENPNGDLISFKFFQSSSCQVMDLVETVTFANGSVFGTLTSPEELHNIYSSAYELDLKVFMEGPVNGSTMITYLNSAFHFIPNDQPYNIAPWNYAGTENVTNFPSNVVDWVLIELRDAPDVESASSGTEIMRQAALLLNDGSVRGLDGTSNLSFSATVTQNIFVLVHHRNHLSVISATPLVESNGVYTYNFSDSPNKAYGGEDAQKELNGIWCMRVGDANADGQIDNVDKNDYWEAQKNSPPGYHQSDFTFDSFVNDSDLNKWDANSGKASFVPE